MSEQASDPGPERDEEDTVIVRGDEDATVIVPRGSAEPDDEDTLSVSGDDDSTVIVGDDAAAPAAGDTASTVILGDEEATVRVERDAPELMTVRLDRGAASAVRPAMVPQRGRRRDELRPAPVPSGFGGVPLVASGAGAVSSYRARTLAPPSAALAAPTAARAPDRVLGGAHSVRAQSRRVAIWTLTAVAGSIVVIGAGIAWALKDLIGP